MRTDKPNVLFLFSDQHKASVLGCEAHPDVRTPNLDGLAAAGTRFSRAYCQNGVCAPSRCSLFSGYYPRTLGCYANSDRSEAMEHVESLQSVFLANGYLTAAFGKRHLHQGCDAGWGIQASHLVKESPDDNYVQWLHAQGLGAAFDRDWAAEWGSGAEGTPAQSQKIPFALMSVRESELPEQMTMEAWTRRRTVEFLRGQADAEKPFFCWASFYRPHQPYTPLPSYFRRFDRSHWGLGRNAGDGLCMPPTLRQPAVELPPVFQEQFLGSNRIWRLDLARADEQIYRDTLAAYYALVEEIDDHIGEILRALEESGQLENTIIIYVSDHGDFVGAHGMVEKCSVGHNVFEDTLRVPLVIRWDGRILDNNVCGGLTELVDIYPTLLDLCGLKRCGGAKPLAGRSLAPALCHGKPTGRNWIVSENAVQSTVIDGRYKLGVWHQPAPGDSGDFRSFGDLLFDLGTDPYEEHNRLGDPALLTVESNLRAALGEWEKEIPLPAGRVWKMAGGA